MASNTQENETPEGQQKTINLPSRLPAPTGNIAYDSVQVSSPYLILNKNTKH